MFFKKNNYKKISQKIMYKSLYFMKRLRLLEEKILTSYHVEKKIKCPVHLCIGQETVSTALNNFLHKDDFLFSHHRSHGYYLAKNCSLNKLVAELYGKVGGSNKGLAGSQDISSINENFYAGAILSGSIGIAVGAAYGLKLANLKKRKVICCFGEGALDQGIFWESINYAALKKLPVIFICENNKYATYSDIKKRMKNTNFINKIRTFGIKTKKVFGNDFAEVFLAIKQAYKSKEPVFIEANTYRISSHVGPEDDSKYYRTSHEISKWKKKCPLKHLEKKVNLKKIDLKKINKELLNAFLLASRSKFYKIKNWEYENLNIKKKKNYSNLKDVSYSSQDTMPEPY
jgi:TPP-dependent pyruvate/acetoin dehydrogenase alpha subunit